MIRDSRVIVDIFDLNSRNSFRRNFRKKFRLKIKGRRKLRLKIKNRHYYSFRKKFRLKIKGRRKLRLKIKNRHYYSFRRNSRLKIKNRRYYSLRRNSHMKLKFRRNSHFKFKGRRSKINKFRYRDKNKNKKRLRKKVIRVKLFRPNMFRRRFLKFYRGKWRWRYSRKLIKKWQSKFKNKIFLQKKQLFLNNIKFRFYKFKKLTYNYYYLNLLFKNNWFFFFKVEDFFLRDLRVFDSLFSFDIFYFYNNCINFSFFYNNLNCFSFFFNKIKKKKSKNIKVKFGRIKFFILFSKGLFYFLKNYEKFLFFRENCIWFFCLKTGFLKKRNLYLWSRVKKIKLSSVNMSKLFFFNSYKYFVNILGLTALNLNLKFFKSKILFYVYKNKITYIKFFNYFWKLLVNKSCFKRINNNFVSISSFAYNKFFFFKFKEGFLKFFFPSRKIVSFNKKLSFLKNFKNPFFFNFLDRYLNFFKGKVFSINKKQMVVLRDLNFIRNFLVKI